ncbi:MAG: ATP-binding protein [Thermodesulfobacteriota bacterium]|nr:ATP-binding protein [Thermodesulfobacteriota bacterium]
MSLLAMVLTGLMTAYWTWVLEPQLMAKAEVTARALAQSHVHALADELESVEGDVKNNDKIKAMEKTMNQILLLTDPNTGSPFILGMEIEVDYGVVRVPQGELDLKKGSIGADDFFVTEIPLYSKATRELLGIARLHNSREFFYHFKKDVRLTFFVGAGIGLIILVLAWRVVIILFEKIENAQKKLQEKQVQIVHAGRLAAMGEMASGIAHEINQPLAIIRIAADGLNSYFSAKDSQTIEARAAKKIISHVDRAADIIENMRSFVRPRPDTPELISLAEPIMAALSFFKEQFRIHRIILTLSIPADEIKVRVNPQKFEQIVVNILSNARFAVEKKGEVEGTGYQKEIIVCLSHDAKDNLVIFEVKDNGIGMKPEVLERCMEPFFTTKDVGEGMGLGLSIVHSIVKESGMDMEVESIEGEGTTFRIKIKGRG